MSVQARKGDNLEKFSAGLPAECSIDEADPLRKRRDTRRPELAGRFFTCFLVALFLVQQIALASPACPTWGSISSREGCCCGNISNPQASSCCPNADTGRDASGRSLTSAGRCTCEVRAPWPLPALPRDVDARGVDGSRDRTLDHWIGSGARASASTPILGGVSPPGEPGVVIDPSRVFPCAPAPKLARGARGLLTVICVARC